MDNLDKTPETPLRFEVVLTGNLKERFLRYEITENIPKHATLCRKIIADRLDEVEQKSASTAVLQS